VREEGEFNWHSVEGKNPKSCTVPEKGGLCNIPKDSEGEKKCPMKRTRNSYKDHTVKKFQRREKKKGIDSPGCLYGGKGSDLPYQFTIRKHNGEKNHLFPCHALGRGTTSSQTSKSLGPCKKRAVGSQGEGMAGTTSGGGSKFVHRMRPIRLTKEREGNDIHKLGSYL